MTRRSVVSGLFFPESAGHLSQVLAGLGQGQPQGGQAPADRVRGVVVPHASIEYCGKVAAALWSRVRVPDHVIVIGPNHTGLGAVAAVADRYSYSTPSGTIEMDRDLASAIVDACPLLSFDDEAHHEEHSIEAVLPHIQLANPSARLAALCLRSMSYSDCARIASTIAAVVADFKGRGEDVLLVASSDLNHNEPLRIGIRKDRMVLDRMVDLDAPGLYQAVVDHHITMCGVVPVVVMMLAARQAGAGYGELVGYQTSMDCTGDPSSVVGYGAVMLRDRCPADEFRRLDHGSGAEYVTGSCGDRR